MRMSGYPETVVVSSQGPAAEMFPLAMGVYTMTDLTHSDRPVWRGRDGTLLFNGKFVICLLTFILIIIRQSAAVATVQEGVC